MLKPPIKAIKARTSSNPTPTGARRSNPTSTMSNPAAFTLFISFAFFLLLNPYPSAVAVDAEAANNSDELKTYIVHVKYPKSENLVNLPETMKVWYDAQLDKVPGVGSTVNGEDRIVHAYSHAMTGFAARFTKKELAEIEKQDWFLYSHADTAYTLHSNSEDL